MGLFPSAAVFVESRVAGVEILRVEVILRDSQSFAKPLEMYDLALSQEADRIADIRVIGKSENVVVGRSCLLLGGHVLREVGDYIAL